MKKFFCFFAIIYMLSSCSVSNYYQICEVTSNLDKTSDGAYEYKTGDCKIDYDFWNDNGQITFFVTNNSDEMMYIDLAKSFLIKNGIAYDYFLHRSNTSSRLISSSSSAAATASVYSLNSLYDKYPAKIYSTYGEKQTSQKAASITVEESPIIIIPPHATKILSEYSIMGNRFTDCDLYESPSKKESVSMSFSEDNSPLKFTNYISFHIGENGLTQTVENEFYISKITNFHEDAVLELVNTKCDNDEYSNWKYIFIKSSPTEFYIKYQPRKQKKSMQSKNSKASKNGQTHDNSDFENIY